MRAISVIAYAALVACVALVVVALVSVSQGRSDTAMFATLVAILLGALWVPLAATRLEVTPDHLERSRLLGLWRTRIPRSNVAGMQSRVRPADRLFRVQHFAVYDRKGVQWTLLTGFVWKQADLLRLRDELGWAPKPGDLRNKYVPYIDPTHGDLEAAQLRGALESGSWQPVEAALSKTTDLTRREFLATVLGNVDGRPPWVDQWAQQKPESPAARLVWGSQTTTWAWEARTGQAAEDVAAEAWKVFFERLKQADEQLHIAAEMAPEDSAPWICLMRTGVGLEVGEEEHRLRYEEAVRRNPESEEASRLLLTALSLKWGGSHDAMWEFVHQRIAAAPDGSPLHMLVAMGHIEAWLGERMLGDEAKIHHSRYFERPEIQEEIRGAWRRYLGATPATSPWEGFNRQWFAVSFYLMRDFAAAKAEIEKIGLGIQRTPFGYLGGPLKAYASVREATGVR